ncbi:MAG: hypothetical protein KDA85_22160 [Planctomycetaceae bacterium]|nr:hypothetical protein [Planctomycetaceae bacterium]
MKSVMCFSAELLGLLIVCCAVPDIPAQELPTDEAAVIAYLTDRGMEIRCDDAGHAVRLMSQGRTPLSAAEYALIGRLPQLEQMGLNAAPLKAEEWAFLQSLRNLKTLSIWHGHHFATLEPFCGLSVESLTIGGCMGIRDLNRDRVDAQRDSILTLHDLPNLKKANLYHSPLAPDDAHLKHLATSFPKLEELRLDVSAPRGTSTSITPAGLAALQQLPLKVLSLENASTFQAEHFESLAGISTLTDLLIDARRQPVASEAIEVFRRLRADVHVDVAGADATGPPMPKRR